MKLQVKRSNIISGQALQTIKRSNITSGQTVKHYIGSNIRSVNLVLTKHLAVHTDWQTPLVSLGNGHLQPKQAYDMTFCSILAVLA
jgi:hypothetical protein